MHVPCHVPLPQPGPHTHHLPPRLGYRVCYWEIDRKPASAGGVAHLVRPCPRRRAEGYSCDGYDG